MHRSIKRLISMFMAAAMIMTVLPAQTFAAEPDNTPGEPAEVFAGIPEYSETGAPDPSAEGIPDPQIDSDGEIGGDLPKSDIHWSLDPEAGTLTLTGSGPMESFSSINAVPWKDYSGQITSVRLDPAITAIGAYAFSGCKQLKAVTLPDSLESIGRHAFANCAGLLEITVPEKVTSLGEYAFRNCGVLKTVKLPDSLESIGSYAFDGCTSLGEIVIPEKAVSVESHLFNGCTSLASVRIRGAVTGIGSYAFYQCAALKTVTLPDSLKTIGSSAFSSCSSLREIAIPGNVTGIGNYAFSKCAALETVTLPDSLETLGSSVFEDCVSLTGIVLPEKITGIGRSAFNGCTALATVRLPGKLESIGQYAFYECAALEEVAFPNTLKTIDKYAFTRCTSLAEVTLPEGVTTLGSDAFSGCKGLKAAHLPSTLTAVEGYTFSWCTALKDVVLENGIPALKSGAFSSCTSLERITLPPSIKTIGSTAFKACTGLKEAVFSEGLETIDASAFEECSSLTEIRFPSTVKKLGNKAFQRCSRLTLAYFYGDAPTLGTGCFNSLSGITLFYLKDRAGWTTPDWNGYPAMPFSEDSEVLYYPVEKGSLCYDRTGTITGCTGAITQIILPASISDLPITAIADGAFRNCTTLKEVCVPNSVTRIGEEAFPEAVTVSGGAKSAASSYAAANSLAFTPVDVSSVSPAASSVIGGDSREITLTMRMAVPLITPPQLSCKDADGNGRTVEYTVRQSVSKGNCVYKLTLDLTALESGMHTFTFFHPDYGLTYTVRYSVDRTPPLPPEGLTVTPGDLQNTVSWQPAAQTKVTAYRVYRAAGPEDAYSLRATVSGRNTQSYTDKEVQADTEYLYKVASVDKFGMEGKAAGPVSCMPDRDKTPPRITYVSPADQSVISGAAKLQVRAEDNIKLRSITAAFSADGTNWTGEQTVETSESAVFTVDTAKWGQTLYVRLHCEDIYGNRSEADTVYRYTIDNQGPGQVTGLQAEVSDDGTVTLRWNAVGDQDLSYYLLEQKNPDGTFSANRRVTGAPSAALTGLTPETNYVFRVCAVDKQGNRGTPSEEIPVNTGKDAEAPVIASLSPAPGRYHDSIPLSIRVKDNVGVSKVTVQISRDGSEWNDAGASAVSESGTSVSVRFSLPTADLPEGLLYVRAVAEDLAGNRSDGTSGVSFVQYMIDHTPPAVPQGLRAERVDNLVSLTWTQGPESDLRDYTVYRASAEDGPYEVLASNLRKLYYTDKSAGLAPGSVWYYKITCRDTAGNVSGYSAPANDRPAAGEDVLEPRVISIAPSLGSRTDGDAYVVSKDSKISVKVFDDRLVTVVQFRYRGDGEWSDWQSADVYAAEWTGEIPVPVAELDGSKLTVEVFCEDAAGSRSQTASFTCTVDRSVPAAPVVTTESRPMAVEVRWTSGGEADLAGFCVYRRESAKTEYTVVAQVESTGETEYSYTDSGASVDANYSYYVAAIDQSGNAAESPKTEFVQPLDRDDDPPAARISGSKTGAAGEAIWFSGADSHDNVGIAGYVWDFGDGGSSTLPEPTYTYQNAGQYTVTLTVSDEAGHQDSAQFAVTVKEREETAVLMVTVRDEKGSAISGASVCFDFSSDARTTVRTDSSGVAKIRAEAGSYTVAAYQDEYLPAMATVSLAAGQESFSLLTLEKGELTVGEVTTKRMTLQEIEEAGIDASDPDNQQLVETVISLTYKTEVSDSEGFELRAITNEKGEVPQKNNGNPPGGSSKHYTDKSGKERKRELLFGSSGTGKMSGGGSGSGKDDEEEGEEDKKKTHPVYAVLDMPAEVTWTKDMFDVRLYLLNAADPVFTLDDCTAQLDVPSGLTLLRTLLADQSADPDKTVTMGCIPGQSSASVGWILRGDTAGEYMLNADFSATLRNFGTALDTRFASGEPLLVRNGDNLHLEILTEDTIQAYSSGKLRLGLRNADDEPYYNVSLDFDDDTLHMTPVRTLKTLDGKEVGGELNQLEPGETLWYYYQIPRSDWEMLFRHEGKTFNLVNRVCTKLGNSNLQVHFGTFKDGDPSASTGIIRSLNASDDGKPVNLLTVQRIFAQGGNETVYLTADVDWGDEDPGRIRIVQNDAVCLESDTGSFGAVQPGKIFDPEGGIYIKAIGTNGAVLETKRVMLKVRENPPDHSDYTFKLFDTFSFTIDGEKPVLSNQKFEIDLEEIAAEIELDHENGTFRVVMGVNIPKEGGAFEDSRYEWVKETVKECRHNAQTALRGLKKLRSSKLGRVSGFRLQPDKDVSTSVCGYIEGLYTNGQFHITEGGLVAGAELSYTQEGQLLVTVVPVYYTIGAGGELELSVGIKSLQAGPEPKPGFAGNLEIAPYFEIGGGLGVVYVGQAGSRGKVTLDINIALDRNYQKVELTGQAFFEIKVLSAQILEYEIASGTWTVYETDQGGEGGVAGGGEGGGGGTDWSTQDPYASVDIGAPVTPEDRSYADRPAEWAGGSPAVSLMAGGSEEQALRVLQENAYPGAQPQLMNAGGKEVLVWITDNPDRTDLNKTMLVYSVYDPDGDTWSEPRPLLDNDTADYYPAAKDGCVVLQKANQVFDGKPTLKDLAQHSEIYAARFNGTGFDTPVRLTENSVMDAQPHLSVSDGEVTVVWTRNTEDDILGVSGTNAVYQRTFDGSVWSAETQLAEGLNAVTYLDAGRMGGETVIACAIDGDGSLNTVEDREIFLIRNGAVERFTDNGTLDSNPVFSTLNGVSVLFWYSDSNLYYISDLDEPVLNTAVSGGIGRPTDAYTVLSRGSSTAVLWTAVENGVSEIHGALYDGSQWSRDIALTRTGAYVRYPNGLIDEDGRMLIAFNRTQNAETGGAEQAGAADLCALWVTPGCDLAVEDAFLDGTAAPNTELPVCFTVVNTGELPVSQIGVDLLDPNGNVNGHFDFAEILQPGEEADIRVSYQVGETVETGRIRIRISTSSGSESDLGNNESTLGVGQSDVSVLNVSGSGTGRQRTVTVTLKNMGYTAARGVTAALLDQTETEITAKTVGDLEPQEEQSVDFAVDMDHLTAEDGFAVLTAAAHAASESEDANRGNNTRGFALAAPDASGDGGYAITEIKPQDGGVRVSITGESGKGGTLIIAAYTKEGKMLRSAAEPVSAGILKSGAVSVDMDLSGAAWVSGFFVDSESNRPLSPKKTQSLDPS